MLQPQLPEAEEQFKSVFREKFVPLRIIDHGGFGCVFETKCKLLGRKYAVKRIPLTREQASIESDKVSEDAKALELKLSLDHPGIVKFHSAWIETPLIGWQRADMDLLNNMLSPEQVSHLFWNYADNCAFLYIQMELCQQSLTNWLRANNTRDLKRMKSWFKQIVEAVKYIHENNLIHRDLKPGNVLIFSKNIVKICDFGVATILDNGAGALTLPRTYSGTQLYIAPEQNSFCYDEKVDIFTLGLILIELCAVLNTEQRKQIVDDIRRRKAIHIFDDQPLTAEFVEKLTRIEPNNRPSCREMLEHEFLA